MIKFLDQTRLYKLSLIPYTGGDVLEKEDCYPDD